MMLSSSERSDCRPQFTENEMEAFLWALAGNFADLSIIDCLKVRDADPLWRQSALFTAAKQRPLFQTPAFRKTGEFSTRCSSSPDAGLERLQPCAGGF